MWQSKYQLYECDFIRTDLILKNVNLGQSLFLKKKDLISGSIEIRDKVALRIWVALVSAFNFCTSLSGISCIIIFTFCAHSLIQG